MNARKADNRRSEDLDYERMKGICENLYRCIASWQGRETIQFRTSTGRAFNSNYMYCDISSAATRHIYGYSIRREIPEIRIDKPDAFYILCPENIPELTLHRPFSFLSLM